jgi:hypothetical protein
MTITGKTAILIGGAQMKRRKMSTFWNNLQDFLDHREKHISIFFSNKAWE